MLIIYLCVINIVAFCVYGYDKECAIKQLWRVSEKTLFLLAIAGGSLGAWVGMYKFRHKTQKRAFKVGIPLILAVQCVLLCIAIWGIEKGQIPLG